MEVVVRQARKIKEGWKIIAWKKDTDTEGHGRKDPSGCAIAGNWKVGDDKDIGTGIAGIYGPHGFEEWPNNILSKWQFYDGDEWQEAKSSEIVFEDCSPKGNLTFT